MSVILNQGQSEASEMIKDFLNGKLDLPYFTLTGGPGTGKTFMLHQTLINSGIRLEQVTGATIAHSAKNVLKDNLPSEVDCYTVAQWLGLKMKYEDDGSIKFLPDKYSEVKLTKYKVGILDEASMADDYIHDEILRIVDDANIKLIVVGDVYQLPPVGQDHDSKFFDTIEYTLTETMRFKGPIGLIADVYRKGIKELNEGFAGDNYLLNRKTNREDSWDEHLGTGYKFSNDLKSLLSKVANEIKSNPTNINFSRVLAFKNKTVDIINQYVRKQIYGENSKQFEPGEILISKGGYSYKNRPIIYNGELFQVEGTREIIGPHGVPCLSIKFKGFTPYGNIVLPVLKDTPEAVQMYSKIKYTLLENAKRDSRQWYKYYRFVDEFAYFDYASCVNAYKSQGQTINNVYVLEGEIMSVKPLTLKQKYQALYVGMTRATKSLYIYNKDY